jgi:hypothetical protein
VRAARTFSDAPLPARYADGLVVPPRPAPLMSSVCGRLVLSRIMRLPWRAQFRPPSVAATPRNIPIPPRTASAPFPAPRASQDSGRRLLGARRRAKVPLIHEHSARRLRYTQATPTPRGRLTRNALPETTPRSNQSIKTNTRPALGGPRRREARTLSGSEGGPAPARSAPAAGAARLSGLPRSPPRLPPPPVPHSPDCCGTRGVSLVGAPTLPAPAPSALSHAPATLNHPPAVGE